MERNIFETSANMQPKPSAKKKPAAISTGRPKRETYDPKVSEMLQKMAKMRDELESQLATLCKGKNYLNLEKLNVSSEQLNQLVEQQAELEQRINEIITPESGILKRTKSKDELTQERKTKTLAARKKNWISMR